MTVIVRKNTFTLVAVAEIQLPLRARSNQPSDLIKLINKFLRHAVTSLVHSRNFSATERRDGLIIL